MPLTEEQQRKARSWFNERITNKRCPSCGGTNWETGDIISPPVETGGRVVIPAPRMPQLPMTCSNCGYVRLYAAMKIGLLA